MLISLLYVILALLALSFLIFIHELGHYWMARRVGMRVETFSIGIGKPIYFWEHDGVKWQIGWLFFGGYVKIAGQEPDDERDPHDIPESFFGKSPWARIKVAFAGPFMNLLAAFIFFAAIWALGGREKNFSEFTPKIGWVDPKSELYADGVRPGDEVVAYGDHAFQGYKDHLFVPMTSDKELKVTINKVDYKTGKKTPKTFDIEVYEHPDVIDKGIKTTGITQSASYVLYDSLSEEKNNPLPEGSPMIGSGLELGDRIFWVDGELIFSLHQLNRVLNDDRVLLTIERNGQRFLRRVPRVEIQEIKLDAEFREELVDWQYEAGLGDQKFRTLYAVPYNLNNNAVVEGDAVLIDKDKSDSIFPKKLYSTIDEPLKAGDRIAAINGEEIDHAAQLFKLLQTRRVNIIVERQKELEKPISWSNAEAEFDHQVNWANLQKIVDSIGTDHPVKSAGNYFLLKTVTPKKITAFTLSEEARSQRDNTLQARRKVIEKIEDPEKRAYALNLLENQENQLVLGIPNIQDRKVDYDPSPVELFDNVVSEIGRTLSALLTGTLNPKWMSGPVGIIQMVHDNSMLGFKEGLYWLGLISLNLGILNLLPIPVLDGGTIVFSLYEMITRRRISPKVMEKLVIPFALLLVAFFIFLTYNDLMRLFSRFWS